MGNRPSPMPGTQPNILEEADRQADRRLDRLHREALEAERLGWVELLLVLLLAVLLAVILWVLLS